MRRQRANSVACSKKELKKLLIFMLVNTNLWILVKLLVNWAHQQTLHGGPATVQVYLEQKYHLISAVIAYNLKNQGTG